MANSYFWLVWKLVFICLQDILFVFTLLFSSFCLQWSGCVLWFLFVHTQYIESNNQNQQQKKEFAIHARSCKRITATKTKQCLTRYRCILNMNLSRLIWLCSVCSFFTTLHRCHAVSWMHKKSVAQAKTDTSTLIITK